ncbi:MAG: heparinase II/III family protein [Clostridia bacterium]|nr:heparinase II/III family protein [Clostridia bacterium]
MASSRTGWTTDSSMLLMSAKNGGNHNHKDSLHMMFYARDKELLADTGMTSYDGGHPHFQWQRHTTRSHNTIEIDGTAQRGSNYLYNYSTSSANWNGEASLDLYSSEPVDRIVAWTDATEGFRHYRNVSYIKNHNFLIVSDMVSPEDDEVHSYTQNWHTSAKSTQYNTIDNTTKIGRTNFSGGTNLLIAQANTDNLELTLETGYSADSSNTTKYFCYTQKAAGDIMYNTVLYPTEEGSTTNISVENIDTGVDPAVASAMDINLFKDNEDVLNVFYYNSFEETPSERTFNGYTTDSANVTIEQDVDGIPQFLSMYNGSNVSRDGKSVISSDVVLTDIEVMYDDKAAIITSKDENISSAKLALMAPHEITSVTINGEAADYICTGDTIYINNNELVDFAQDGGYFVHITAVDDKGNKFPITFDIPESCVTSGALAMPACTYSDGAFVVTFGDAVLSSGAKITVGSHTNEDVYAVIGGSKVKITNTIRVGSTQEYADAYVSVDSPALERAREDLVIWTRNVTEFTIGASEEASGGSSGGGSSGGG